MILPMVKYLESHNVQFHYLSLIHISEPTRRTD